MKFLAIHTAGDRVETALYADGKIFYKSDTEFKKASAVLFPFIDETLNGAGITPAELDFIAAVTGPGSFTGIRIGLTAARALAQFSNLKVVPVTYAEVLSYNNTDSSAESIVTISDAANGFCYVAAFDGSNRSLMPPAVLKNEDVERFLSLIDEPCVVCADAAAAKFAVVSGKKTAEYRADGSALVQAVLAAYERGGAVPYEEVTPLYVRQSQAEENSKPVFRPAKPPDIAAVAALEKQYIECPWPVAEIEKAVLNPDYVFWVAESGGVVIGYASARVTGAEAEINNIAVHENFRRKGIAEKLLNGIVENSGAKTFFLEVADGNAPATALYEKNGFNKISIRKNYYGGNKDALIYKKER